MATALPAGLSNPRQLLKRSPLASLDPIMSSSNKSGELSIFNEIDDSFEVEVPDFHFDWKLDKDKVSAEKSASASRKSPSTHFASMSISESSNRPSSLSPPSHVSVISAASRATPPPRSSHSARSSLSSAQVTSLTDASTASGSSLAPTPPGSGFSIGTRSASSHGLDSGGSASGSGGSQRIYGAGGRKFQRVVSAPIGRSKYEGDDNGMLTIEESSTLSASTTSHTATMRPPLTHTSSASSVPQNHSSTALPRSSNYVTPGLTDRTLSSTTRSTGRRLGGLSKFGGPARRVVPALEAEELQEEAERASPVLIASPPRNTSSPISRPAAEPQRSPVLSDQADLGSKFASSSSRHRSPPITRYDGLPLGQASQIPSSSANDRNPRENVQFAYVKTPTRNQPDEGDQPFRPFSSQINRPGPSASRHIEQPTDVPSHTRAALPRRSPPTQTQERFSPPIQQPLRAVRPAPSVSEVPERQSSMAIQHTAPPMLGQSTKVDAPAPPAAPAPATRASFMVNSVPYERLQRLGKGGSSTVYSVLYSAPPKKRIIYAMKLVQLDRADEETYQSYTNEIDLLKRLRGHDRVIQLIDHQITFNSSGRPHRLMMVMECGEIDFAALLDEQRGKAINMNFVGLYWEQMLEAVQAVHKENVVHTDLKPANFVLVKGRLKIIDFGIAKAVANDTVNIQRDQQVINYMSPEAIQRMNNQKVLKVSSPRMGAVLISTAFLP
ncbi:uncharacterized protein I206_107189 [Kwoniella pini CBS 10737]|uniref:Protein kinase domain-containing protein n=1 Tax=Kwoniella pini CBS 10737 TaxID=1296096 RepID=A0AAJ8MTL4_9TREE